MKKAIVASLLVTLIVSLGVVVLGGADVMCLWPNIGGNSGRQSYCHETVHPPYLSNWEAAIPQGHHILASNDYLFAICSNEVIIFHTNSREEVGSFNISGPCTPVLYGDLFISYDGAEISARHISSNTIAWDLNIDEPLSLVSHMDSIFANNKTKIIKIDSDGNILTTVNLPDEPVCDPTVVGNKIVFACRDMRLHVYDIDTLTLVCSSSTVGFIDSITATDDDSFVAVLERGGSIVMSSSDCKQLWSDKTPTGKNKGAVSEGNWVYLYGSDSGIYCKSVEGDTSWTNKTLSPINVSISGRILLCNTRNSQIVPVQKSTGTVYNTINTPGDITSQSIPHKGSLYVLCGPKLICYTTSPFGQYLGLSCDLNFGIICPEKIYTREIVIENLSSTPISARIHTFAKKTSTDKKEVVIYPEKPETITVSVKTEGVLSLQDFGEIIIDTSNYRYKLGVNFFVKQVEGDCNLDCIVDAADLIIIAAYLGKRSYNPDFKPECDFDNNGIIDLNDVSIMRDNFGKRRE